MRARRPYQAAALTRLRLAPDTDERHALAARLAGRPETVLDVGGVKGQLAALLPQSRVTTVNVDEPADVVFDGATLPFPDRSFELVTSLDVLEHLQREERAAHLRELARVAASHIVLCCPLGTQAHALAEAELAAWHAAIVGRRHRFLDEHVVNGLPTEAELRDLVAPIGDFSFQFRYHGDFRRIQEVFRLGVVAKARRRPRALAAYARRRLTNRPDLVLDDAAGPFTNRVFLHARRLSSPAARPSVTEHGEPRPDDER